MILNQSQAEAVYSAMCTLNNVSANEFIVKIDRCTSVSVGCGIVHVKRKTSDQFEGTDHEHYEVQSAFAAAYNLS